MIAYILEGTGPQGGAADKRMARLAGAGPWQYQPHQLGTMATWRTTGPVSRGAFGEERRTTDGLLYLPPKVLPDAASLLRPQMVERPDMADVMISAETGTVIKIIPAFMSPRQILDNNTVGDFSTVYGRATRALLDRISENPKITLGEVGDEMAECCRLAIIFTYRMTRELLTDMGWLNEESLSPIWGAAITLPKARPAAAGGN